MTGLIAAALLSLVYILPKHLPSGIAVNVYMSDYARFEAHTAPKKRLAGVLLVESRSTDSNYIITSMDIENVNGYTLRNLNRINFLLGKNGCGKSTLLKRVEEGTKGQPGYGATKYITPERGGHLKYEPGVENNMANDENWMPSSRRVNQFRQFRQQSVAQYRKLETLVLRELEQTPELRQNLEFTFDTYVDEINSLLDNIEIRRHESTFRIMKKGTDSEIQPDVISSGESELISLGIECLVFEKECVEGVENILYLDSPDVHLHPDLQVRLMRFLQNLVDRASFRVLLATHSTAILGSLFEYDHKVIAFMTSEQTQLEFKPINDIYRKILPMFGAHPLSNLFNEAPVLLVDGEDDERVWQQAVRTSQGAIRVYPCPVDGEAQMGEYEQEIQEIINSVYDNAVAYSIRDRDEGPEEINDLPPITRMRLSCREAENLLLSDEVLESLDSDWESLVTGIQTWIANNPDHPHIEHMVAFSQNFDRKLADVKPIRNDLMGIIGSNKPWEVAVGQAIGRLNDGGAGEIAENSLSGYLGQKLVASLL